MRVFSAGIVIPPAAPLRILPPRRIPFLLRPLPALPPAPLPAHLRAHLRAVPPVLPIPPPPPRRPPQSLRHRLLFPSPLPLPRAFAYSPTAWCCSTAK